MTPASAESMTPSPAAPRHVVVWARPGRFAGWPANEGIWSWGNEIVVGFLHGAYEFQENAHSISRREPLVSVLARSLDGGETWSVEDHPEFDVSRAPGPLTRSLDFGHPDFALRCRRKYFWYSYDRGRTWGGPHDLGDFGLGLKLTARTDYTIKSPTEALLFLSAEVEGVQAGNYKDRAFCARTPDGGRTFEFVAWINDDPRVVRGAMPATVRLPSNELVTTLRRRVDLTTKTRAEICWIDAYRSADDGASWQSLARVAYTDLGGRNGNPSSLTRLADGRLGVIYGYRAAPLGMRAKISADRGATWGPEITLRDGAATWDFGYPRSVLRPDGKVVTVYYFTTRERPEQHIAATIWTAG